MPHSDLTPDPTPAHHTAAMMAMVRGLAARTRNIPEAYRDLTQATARGLAVDRCSVWRFEGANRALRLVDLYDARSDAHASGIVLDADRYPTYFREMWSGRLVAANDACTDPRTSEFRTDYLEPLGILSMLDAPLKSASGLLGVLCHEDRQARIWTPSDMRLATFAACLATILMDGLEPRGR